MLGEGRRDGTKGSERVLSAKSSSRLRRLTRRESLKLGVGDVDLATTKTHTPLRTFEEGSSVRVQRLVSGSGAGDRHVDGSGSALRAARVPLLDEGANTELDSVEREEPDNVPDPDDSDPSSRDTTNLGEAPVSVGGDDRGDQLSQAESEEEGDRGTFHEEE